MNHDELYGKLRATILARHFALGRFNRANHFTNDNYLGERPLPDAGLTTRYGCKNDVSLPQRSGRELYQTFEDILGHPGNPVLSRERWRVFRHNRANPLMVTGLRLVSLCVDHRLGHPDAANLVRLVLRTLDSLYKFKDPAGPFAGYILRWDPATTDSWTVSMDAKGRETPEICCEFLINTNPKTFSGQHFLYCTPLDDARYRRKAFGPEHDKGTLRRWEPSIDEYIGLVAGYFIAWNVFKDDTSAPAVEIVEEVKRQLRSVAEYLRFAGYLLVRPGGGFVGNGASGINPCMEFAFSRVFERVLGNPFAVPSENDFDDAIRKAGLWDCWTSHPPLSLERLSQVIEDLFDMPAFINAFGDHPREALGNLFSPERLTNVLIGAAKILPRLECIDVFGDQANDFIVAWVAKKLTAASPLGAFSAFMLKPAQDGNWADYFKPFFGLMALGDPNPALGQLYLEWYRNNVLNKVNSADQEEIFGTEQWSVSVFATAVAALLNLPTLDGVQVEIEKRLEQELERMRAVLEGPGARADLVLFFEDSVREGQDKSPKGHSNWYGYLGALSAAWLHKINSSPQNPLPSIPLPTAGSVAAWPKPIVPTDVIDAAHTDRMPVPLGALKIGVLPRQGSLPVELFDNPPPKPDDSTLGRIPQPQSRDVAVSHRSHSIFIGSRTFVLDPPQLQLVADETPQDYEIVWTRRNVTERNVKSRNERRVGDQVKIELEFWTISLQREWPFIAVADVEYAAEYTVSWARYL